MKITKKQAVALMLALKFKAAGSWEDEKLTKKLNNLNELPLTDDDKPDDKELANLLKACQKALKDGKKIVLGDAAEAPAEPTPKKAEKKAKKEEAAAAATPDEDDEDDDDDDEPAPKKAAADDDDDEDEDEDEDDEEEGDKPAKAKGKKPESAGKDGKPGVIASIIELLKGASKKSPVTKEEMVTELKKRFPDREEKGMKNTINIQVPNRLRSEKKLNIIKTDKGFYIGAGEAE